MVKKYCSLIVGIVVLAFPVAYQYHLAGKFERRKAEAMAGRQAGDLLAQYTSCTNKALAHSAPACGILKEQEGAAPQISNTTGELINSSESGKRCLLCVEAQHLAALQCGQISLSVYDTEAHQQPISNSIVSVPYLFSAKSRDPPGEC